ncbi:MAG TPA: hypothetical protein VE991_00320 [Acidimicrobiales bacterium]|nr:hypothetical protein [Acidimicrobiales bacterium]
MAAVGVVAGLAAGYVAGWGVSNVGLASTRLGPALPAVGCSWTPPDQPTNGVNWGWTDTNDTGYTASYTVVPGGRLVIHGNYAQARFFVMDVYDAKGNAYVPDFLDAHLAPDPGSENPFTTPGVVDPAAQSYTAYVSFTPRPATPAPNTVYAATTADGTAPNPGGLIAYRVYLPDTPGAYSGGVPLPALSYELPGGAVVPLASCGGDVHDPAQPVITQAMTNAGWPAQVPAVVPFPPAKDPADWQAASNPGLDATVAGNSPIGDPLPPSGIGLLTAPANSYLSTRISRQFGQVFVFRAAPPTSPDTRAGQWVGTPSQVRYWSVCINSTLVATQTVACLADHEISLDPDGTFTVTVSSGPDRPAGAGNWLPIGDVYEGWIYIRQFLASPGFGQSISSVGPGQDPATVMGPYFPRSAYCSTALYDARGADGCLSG